MPTPDSCPGKKVSISLEFKMTYHTQRSTQPSVHLITPESHNYWKAISVQKLDSRLRKEIQMWAFRIEWKQNNGPVWRGCSRGNSLINRWTLQQSQSWVRETRRYSPFIPLGGTQGEGGCLAAEASIGSRGWALRLARCSAPRSPVQNRTMDWLREDLTSNMAEQEEDGNKRHQSGQLKLSILNKNIQQGAEEQVQRLCTVTAAHRYHGQSHPISCHVTEKENTLS